MGEYFSHFLGTHCFNIKLLTKVAVFLFIATLPSLIGAQKKYSLFITYSDSYVPSDKNYTPTYDSLALLIELKDKISKLQSQGYIHATIDNKKIYSDTCFAQIYVGDKFSIGRIVLSPEQMSIVDQNGIKNPNLEKVRVDSSILYGYLKTISSYHATHGYPFARVSLDSIRVMDDQVFATLKVDKGKKIVFDSIVNEGNLLLNSHLVRRLLDIFPGDNYDHLKVLRASKRLSQLQYVQQRNNPYVRFINDKASLVISPDVKPASRFDFLIGVLPQVINGERKWNITGDFIAEMNNTFNYGEYSYFQIKRLKSENLELLIKSTIPYLAGLPIGSTLDFRLFKNGNINLDLFFDGGLQYQFGGFNSIRAYASYRSSALLDISLDQIINNKKLPQNLDLTYTGVGIGIQMRDLDYRFNPSNGYEASINVLAGNKKIIPNRQIIDIEGFQNSYDTIKLKTLQLEFDIQASYYTPIQKWATIKTGISGALRYNQQNLRHNELIRIGGNKVLRGFDEESIFTDKYLFGTFEFRLLFDQNSYLTLPFVDYGITTLIIDNKNTISPVFGVGMGLNFGTQAGIFNLSFAVGKNKIIPLDFSRMKIHFGYVNLF